MNQSLTKWGVDLARAPTSVLASTEPIVRLFSWHDAHPITLMMALLEKFGTDWIRWEAETLKSEILTSFKATSISEQNWNKIQAVRTLMTTVGYWKEWEIFEKITQSLNNNIPIFGVGQPCTVAQLMAAVDLVKQIREEAYGEEIQKYWAACALENGVLYLPSPLDSANRMLEKPVYRCNTCGNVDADDLQDGRCDFCVGRYHEGIKLSNTPLPGTPDNVGRDITRTLTHDTGPVKARFESLLKDPDQNLSNEVTEDVQAGKLVVAYNYMLLRRRQLAEQLKELESWVTH
jgi:hypothetical protein